MIMKGGEISLLIQAAIMDTLTFLFHVISKGWTKLKICWFCGDLAGTGAWWVQVLKINFQGYYGRRTEMNLGGPN